MSELTSPPISELSDRIRRLIYRASYTGMKETDLLLGHFARKHLPYLGKADLTDFENLLEVGDKQIYEWVMEKSQLPDTFDTPVFHLIKEFNKE